MWLAVSVETSDASNSFPTPCPTSAASLLMMESSDLPCLTSSSNSRSGVPTPMNPPTITLAPFGIIAMASSADTLFMGCSDIPRLEFQKSPQMIGPLDLDQRCLHCQLERSLWGLLAFNTDAGEQFRPELAYLRMAAF